LGFSLDFIRREKLLSSIRLTRCATNKKHAIGRDAPPGRPSNNAEAK
jgi:hypothetical protein